jgi:hypothetical protein
MSLCSSGLRDEANVVYFCFKPEGKGPLGRPRRRWMDLGEVGWDWIGLAKDRNRWRALVNLILNLRVP